MPPVQTQVIRLLFQSTISNLEQQTHDYTANDFIAALGLALEYYNPDHFTATEPSKELIQAYTILSTALKLNVHHGHLWSEDGHGSDEESSDDASSSPDNESTISRIAWLALVNGVIFPISTMRSTYFNANGHILRAKTASFRGSDAKDAWVGTTAGDHGQCVSNPQARKTTSNFRSWCISNYKTVLGLPDDESSGDSYQSRHATTRVCLRHITLSHIRQHPVRHVSFPSPSPLVQVYLARTSLSGATNASRKWRLQTLMMSQRSNIML